jgi:hypothetical protein
MFGRKGMWRERLYLFASIVLPLSLEVGSRHACRLWGSWEVGKFGGVVVLGRIYAYEKRLAHILDFTIFHLENI